MAVKPWTAEDLELAGRDDGLIDLVVEEAKSLVENPYGELLSRLVGTPASLDEAAAAQILEDASELRRKLTRAAGRPIHLRTALVEVLAESPELFDPSKLARAIALQGKLSEATGLLDERTFLAIVAHELNRRGGPGAVMATFSVLREGEPLAAESVKRLSVLGEVARSRLRTGDARAALDDGLVAALLPGCPPEKAAEIVLRTERELGAALDEDAPTVLSGLAVATRGEPAQTFLDRARAHLVEARQYGLQKEERRKAAPLRERLAIFATTHPDRFLEVQRAFAAAGKLVLPARDHQTALALARSLGAQVLLADVLFPPGGGIPLLDGLLEKLPPSTQGFLVAPARWASLQSGRGVKYPALSSPPDVTRFLPLAEKLLGPKTNDVAVFPDAGLVLALSEGCRVWAKDGALPNDLRFRLGNRPEVALLEAAHLEREAEAAPKPVTRVKLSTPVRDTIWRGVE